MFSGPQPDYILRCKLQKCLGSIFRHIFCVKPSTYLSENDQSISVIFIYSHSLKNFQVNLVKLRKQNKNNAAAVLRICLEKGPQTTTGFTNCSDGCSFSGLP